MSLTEWTYGHKMYISDGRQSIPGNTKRRKQPDVPQEELVKQSRRNYRMEQKSAPTEDRVFEHTVTWSKTIFSFTEKQAIEGYSWFQF